MFERAATLVLQWSNFWQDCISPPPTGVSKWGIGLNAAVYRELGKPLVIKEVPPPHRNVVPGQRSCSRRQGVPREGAGNVRLAACSPDLLILETTEAGWVLHFELIGHTIEWEEACAILSSGCRLGIEFKKEFPRSHEHTGDRLLLEKQVEPGIH